MRKDVADLFAAEGEGAREVLASLVTRAVDALDLVLEDAPEGSARQRFAYAKEHMLPLLTKIEDPGEMEAALEDAAAALKLKAPQVRYLRKTLTAVDELEEEPGEGEPDTPSVPEDQIDELVGRPGVLNRYVEDAAGIHGVV